MAPPAFQSLLAKMLKAIPPPNANSCDILKYGYLCSPWSPGYKILNYAKLFCGNVYLYDGLFGDANGFVTVLMASKKMF